MTCCQCASSGVPHCYRRCPGPGRLRAAPTRGRVADACSGPARRTGHRYRCWGRERVQRGYRRRCGGDPAAQHRPGACYHQIREHTAADSAGARSLICPPAVLEGHLRALTEAGMQPVTSTALVDHLEWVRRCPPVR